MRKIRCIFFILVFHSGFVIAQTDFKSIEYQELLKYKVDENRFSFGWLDNVFSGIPCFRDYTKSDFRTEIIDPKTDSIIYTSSKTKKNALRIVPEIIKIDRKNKKLRIDGKVTGAWNSVIPSEFKIYIGQRKDTVSYTTLAPNLHGDIYYNGEKVDSTIIIDTIPAFYMTDFKKFEVHRGRKKLDKSKYKEMLFNIDALIDKKSILVFGLSSRYAEIFEVGKLLKD